MPLSSRKNRKEKQNQNQNQNQDHNRSDDTHPEGDGDSRRTSLRRLSSIASLHTLNPFSRRRSAHTNSHANSSPSTNTSNASFSSPMAAAASEHPNNITALPPHLPRAHVPQQLLSSSRKASYICLPDDPIGGMPRSRTFGNLPLPTRTKKSTAPLVQSRSHARLPSAIAPPTRLPSARDAPPSRLPTPTYSTRQHSAVRLAGIDNKLPSTKKKLIRSDTEPLLQSALASGTSLPRSTAFKENISLSPIKPLSSMDDDGMFPSSPGAYSNRQAWSSDSEHAILLPPDRSSSLAYSNRAFYGGPDVRSQKFDSSPAYRSARDRPPTPAKAVQRWNSQPLLTTVPTLNSSFGQIKQPRLMSARQAPTPPLPTTPSARHALTDITAQELNRSAPSRHIPEHTPESMQHRLEHPSRARAESLRAKSGAIHTAQPLAQWTGRFSSLNDRYRNEELTTSNLPSQRSSTTLESRWHTKGETDMLHTAEANTARMRRAVEHLSSLCATDEARESFLAWQKAVADALGLPELARPVQGRDGRFIALEMSLKDRTRVGQVAVVSPTSSDGHKASFMERLLGRRQKSVALLMESG